MSYRRVGGSRKPADGFFLSQLIANPVAMPGLAAAAAAVAGETYPGFKVTGQKARQTKTADRQR